MRSSTLLVASLGVAGACPCPGEARFRINYGETSPCTNPSFEENLPTTCFGNEEWIVHTRNDGSAMSYVSLAQTIVFLVKNSTSFSLTNIFLSGSYNNASSLGGDFSDCHGNIAFSGTYFVPFGPGGSGDYPITGGTGDFLGCVGTNTEDPILNQPNPNLYERVVTMSGKNLMDTSDADPLCYTRLVQFAFLLHAAVSVLQYAF